MSGLLPLMRGRPIPLQDVRPVQYALRRQYAAHDLLGQIDFRHIAGRYDLARRRAERRDEHMIP